jgi:signal peptidase I
VFRRVVAGPGARISMKRNHLVIDGRSLVYANDASVSRRGELGDVLELEHGNGWDVHVSYTPGASSVSEFDEFVVPPDSYYVLGSNRDDSEDSRHYGPITRDRIIGRVLRKF